MYTSVNNNNNLKYRLIIYYEFDRELVRYSIIIVNIFEKLKYPIFYICIVIKY